MTEAIGPILIVLSIPLVFRWVPQNVLYGFRIAATYAKGEIHRIANELRITRPDLIALRVSHQRHLPGMSREKPLPRE